jgi:hypothetical protein
MGNDFYQNMDDMNEDVNNGNQLLALVKDVLLKTH